MNFGEINTAIISDPLTEDDLRRLILSATQRVKFLRGSRSLAIAGALRPGMTVGFGDKSYYTSKRSYKEGKIVKMNKTRAVVLVDSMRWTVPFTMLKVIA